MNLPLILRYALRLGAALTLSVSLAACGSDKDDEGRSGQPARDAAAAGQARTALRALSRAQPNTAKGKKSVKSDKDRSMPASAASCATPPPRPRA